MLLIHQGDTPDPVHRRLGHALRGRAEAIGAAYQEVSSTAGVTPGMQLAAPETATTVRVADGETLTTDGPFVAIKEALGGYLLFEADDLDAAIELAAKIPAASMGGAIEVRPDRRSGQALEQAFHGGVGPRPRLPDRLPRRLRPRRGGRPGGVRDRRRALAARRGARRTRAPGW